MDSFGKLLRVARTKKNLTVEEAAEKTSISAQYIIALEKENIDIFPGEAYAIGFLKNYSAYLGLDTEYMASLLRAKRIQESPTPIELLHPRRAARLPLIIALSVVFLGAAFAVWFFLLRNAKNAALQNQVITSSTGGAIYELTDQPFTQRVYANDVLVIPRPGGNIPVTISGTLNSLSLQTPVGAQFVELGEEREFDLDGISGGDIIVFVSDISRTDASRGAQIRVAVKAAAAGDSITGESVLSENSITILTDNRNRTYPFVVNINFNAVCLLRYQVAGNSSDTTITSEKYYTNRDQPLSIQSDLAARPIRFWISNNSAVRMQVVADGKNYDVDITRLGRVAVFSVEWVRARDSAQNFLVVNELD